MAHVNEEYEEFEDSGTYHRSYEFYGEEREEMINFILENAQQSDEKVYIQFEISPDEYRSTQGWGIDDIEAAFDEMDSDLDAYGSDGTGGVTVMFLGSM